MKNLKKYLALTAAMVIFGASTAAFALDVKSPADIVSSITGKTMEDVVKEKTSGKTYGTIAKDAGKLDEFKIQSLDQKKAVLDQRVKDEKITQQKADEIYNELKTNQASCDGTGIATIGKKNEIGFGQGSGQGLGNNQGAGKGEAKGLKNGSGMGTKRGAGRTFNQ